MHWKPFLLPTLAVALLTSCTADKLNGKSAQQTIVAAANYISSKSFHFDSLSAFTFDVSQVPSENLGPYLVSALRRVVIDSHVDVKDAGNISANELVTEGNIAIPVWVISLGGKSYVSSDGVSWTVGTPPSLVLEWQATDPTQQVAAATVLLNKLAPTFKDLGSEQKNGLTTHHLRAPVTVALVAALLATNPALPLTTQQLNESVLVPSGAVDVWIDQVSGYPLYVGVTVGFRTPADGPLAKLALGPPSVPLSSVSATVPVTITNQVSIFGWGNPIKVAVPSVSPGVQPPSFSEFYR